MGMVYKVTRLTVSGQDFFDTVMEGVVDDIHKATTKKVPPHAIAAGYTYKKDIVNRSRNKETVQVKITKLEPGVLYEAEIDTAMGVHTTSFEIKDLGNDQCVVTAGQGTALKSQEGQDTRFHRQNPIVSALIKSSQRKQLKEMEKYIKNKKFEASRASKDEEN
ncbi:MAG: DUF3284 domain-containing protein [Turicibacter sp.]|nr:DUF3284 domain-containing protein [Turicibacter sp.]